MRRIIVFVLAGAVACSTAKPQAGTSSSPSSSPSGSATTAPPVQSRSASPAPKGWKHYRSPEVGVSFLFPPIAGTVEYDFTRHPRASRPCKDDSGLFFRWEAHVQDAGDPYSYWFAGGASRDMGEGREPWPTDIIKWVQSGTKTSVQICSELETVTPIFLVDREDGARAIVYAPKDMFSEVEDPKDHGDRVAVLNFPSSFSPNFDAIVFYFRTPTPVRDIEAVIRSVTFET